MKQNAQTNSPTATPTPPAADTARQARPPSPHAEYHGCKHLTLPYLCKGEGGISTQPHLTKINWFEPQKKSNISAPSPRAPNPPFKSATKREFPNPRINVTTEVPLGREIETGQSLAKDQIRSKNLIISLLHS